jgi:hypothetical protein
VFSRDISTHHKQVVKRTLREAFRGAEYACAIEVHRIPAHERIGGVLLAVCIGVSLACVLVAALS